MSESRSSGVVTLFAWLLLVAAAFAALLSVAFASLLCENGCEGTLRTIRTLEIALPIGGLVPAGFFVLFSHQRRRGWAIVALVVAVTMYALWGVMLELLTHPREHGIAI